MIEIASINPALPHSTGSQIMQKSCFSTCVCLCLRGRERESVCVRIVLIESCWMWRQVSVLHFFMEIAIQMNTEIFTQITHTNTHIHTLPWRKDTLTHCLESRHNQPHCLESRQWGICSHAEPSYLSIIVCMCGPNGAHKGYKILCRSTWK